MDISPRSQSALVQYLTAAVRVGSQQMQLRSSMQLVDREYMRVGNSTPENISAKRRNEAGDKRVMRDVTVPVLYPQTESAHAYLCSVFLSGYPIFSTVTSPENSEAGDMMDAVNADHQLKGNWVRALSLALRNGLKYNIMAVECSWHRQSTFGLARGNSGDISAKPINWEGNVMRNLDLYNTFWDNRVPIAEVHKKGEFAGYNEIISRVAMKQLLNDLPDEGKLKNAKEALESAFANDTYFIPTISEKGRLDADLHGFNWESWALNDNRDSSRIVYQNVYCKTTLYARILPEDFDLRVPARSTPQIWKLIYINNKVLIYAEKMTNAHNFLPIIFGSPLEDGLEYQTPSFAENLLEVQDMASSLWKVRIATARRNVSDRAIYNPQFIRPEDINSSNPSAKIPLRPNQYLDDIRKAFYSIPFNGNAADGVIPDAQQIMEFGRSISGISRPLEGQFMKGNRTLGEYEDVRGNGNQRLQVMSLFLQTQFFTPLKEIIKYNVLQFVKPGQVYYSQKRQNVDINPQVMQDAALDFKLSDGNTPTSKIANETFLQTLLQLVMTVPEMQQRFDIVKFVDYLGSLQNVPGLAAFERQNPPQNSSQNPSTSSEVPASQPPVPPPTA